MSYSVLLAFDSSFYYCCYFYCSCPCHVVPILFSLLKLFQCRVLEQLVLVLGMITAEDSLHLCFVLGTAADL